MKWSNFLLVSVAALTGIQAGANVKMPNLFSNNMILQRDSKANVWGWADDGEEVTVNFSRGRPGKPPRKMAAGWSPWIR